MCKRERERDIEMDANTMTSLVVCVSGFVLEREGDRGKRTSIHMQLVSRL